MRGAGRAVIETYRIDRRASAAQRSRWLARQFFRWVRHWSPCRRPWRVDAANGSGSVLLDSCRIAGLYVPDPTIPDLTMSDPATQAWRSAPGCGYCRSRERATELICQGPLTLPAHPTRCVLARSNGAAGATVRIVTTDPSSVPLPCTDLTQTLEPAWAFFADDIAMPHNNKSSDQRTASTCCWLR